MSSVVAGRKKNKDGGIRHVQFAEHEDIFILPPEEGDEVDNVDALLLGSCEPERPEPELDVDMAAALSYMTAMGMDAGAEHDLVKEKITEAPAVTVVVEEEDTTEIEVGDEDDDVKVGEEGINEVLGEERYVVSDDDDESSSSSEEDDDEEEEAGDGDDDDDKTQYNFGEAFIQNQSRMRDAVQYWSATPYSTLLEDAVEEEGEAEGVQKFITCFVRIEENGDCPRGLERQICARHNEARRALIENQLHTVLMHDFRLRYQEKNLTDEEIWKELRNISKKLSKGAQAFARKIGKADEAVVHRGPVDSKGILEHLEEVKEKRWKSNVPVRQPSDGGSTDPSASATRRLSGDSTKKKSSKSHHHSKKSSSSRDKKTKADKKERKSPGRTTSLSLKRKEDKSSKSKDKKDKSSKNSKDAADVDLLFDVDKRGKTKPASRWKSLKQRLSASSHKRAH